MARRVYRLRHEDRKTKKLLERIASKEPATETARQDFDQNIPEVAETNIVRCAYCIFDFELRPMLARLEGVYICANCGHTADPDDREYRCRCRKCVDLAFLRVAS